MSQFGLNTMTAMRTICAPPERASATNITTAVSPTAKAPTSTKPATSTSGSGASIVVGNQLNYMKLIPMHSSSGGTTTLHVIGWSFGSTDSLWRPVPLASYTVVASGVASTVNGSSLYAGITYTKLAGDGKNYDVNATITNAGMLMIDTIGCDLIELVWTGSGTANAYVSFI